jgi:hypothetical protein
MEGNAKIAKLSNHRQLGTREQPTSVGDLMIDPRFALAKNNSRFGNIDMQGVGHTEFLQGIQKRLQVSGAGCKQGEIISIQQDAKQLAHEVHPTLGGPLLQPRLHPIDEQSKQQGGQRIALLDTNTTVHRGTAVGPIFHNHRGGPIHADYVSVPVLVSDPEPAWLTQDTKQR